MCVFGCVCVLVWLCVCVCLFVGGAVVVYVVGCVIVAVFVVVVVMVRPWFLLLLEEYLSGSYERSNNKIFTRSQSS